MLDSWVVGYAIEFSDGGSVRGLEAIARASQATQADVDRLTASVGALRDMLLVFGDASDGVMDAVNGIDAATRTASASARAAAASYDLAADSLTAQAAAYDAAAASAGRYNAAMAGGRSAGAASFLGSFGSGGGGGGGGIGSLVGMAGALPGPIGAVSRIAGAASSAVNTITGGALGHLAEAASLVDALYEAGHYQTQLQAISNVTGATGSKLAGIDQLLFKQASIGAMSPNEAAKMYLDMARQTPNLSVAQRNALMPDLTKASVVLGATRGMSPQEVSEGMVSMLHLFQLYQPKQMQQGVDLFTRGSEMMGINFQRALTQYAYFVPSANTLGVDPRQDIAIMAELANMGMGRQRGGTAIAGMINSMVGNGVGGAGAKKALEKLHILGPDGKPSFVTRDPKTGKESLNIIGALTQLNKDRGGMDQVAFNALLRQAFGLAAARVVAPLTTDVQQKQRTMTYNRLGQDSLSLDKQYNTLMGQFDPTVKQTVGNFQALAMEIGKLMLPAATIGFRDLGDALHDAQAWLHANSAGEHEFIKQLTDDVNMVAGFVRDHKGDFAAIATDLGIALKDLNDVAKVAMLVGGALGGTFLKAVRIIGDVATGRWSDLQAALGGTPGQQNKYDPGKQIIPGARPPVKVPAHGAIPDANNARNYAALFGNGAVQVHVDARGMSDEQATKVVKAGVKQAMDELKKQAHGNPQHATARHGAIQTGPHQPTRNMTPIAAGG